MKANSWDPAIARPAPLPLAIPRDRKTLVYAAALIIAEIERMDRCQR